MRTIDDALYSWIAENLVAGGHPDDLIAGLLGVEIDAQEAKDAVYSAMNHPFMKIAVADRIKLQKREALLKTLDFNQRLDPDYLTITPEKLPPYATFIKKYYAKNRPGLFKNAIAHWPAMQWTPRKLANKVGADTLVEIQKGRDNTKEYELQKARFRTEVRLGDFVDMVETADSNDSYLTANNHALNNGPFKSLSADVGTLGDGYLDPAHMDSCMFLWLGPKGTVTPLHHDNTNNIFIQVYGKKRFRLIPATQVPYMYNDLGVFTPVDLFDPKPEQYPLYQRTNSIDITVEAGDFLFIPIGWWHHVVSETASISLSFTNFNNISNYFVDYPNR